MINHLTLQSEGRDLGSLTDSWTLSNVASVYPIFARVWFHRYLVPLVSDPFGGSAVCFCFLAYQTICFELSILGSTNTLTTIQLTKFCCHCLLSSLLSLWVYVLALLNTYTVVEISEGVEAMSTLPGIIFYNLSRDCRKVHGLAFCK